MRALRGVAVSLIVLLGLQSMGSRALLLCLCEYTPQVGLAAAICCAAEQPLPDEVPVGNPSVPADDCNECVVIALGIDDAVILAAPVLAAVVAPPHWEGLLVSLPVASLARMAVFPRPPPLLDPGLRHLATVRLTI